MTIILQTRSLSWAESVRIALIGEGIEAVVLDQASPSTLGLMGSIRVAIANDADLARANEVVASLEPPKSAPLSSWRWHKLALISFVAGALLSRMAQFFEESSRRTERALMFASLILVVAAVFLMIKGYRADKSENVKVNP